MLCFNGRLAEDVLEGSALLCYVVLCYVALCYALLRRVMLYCVTKRYVIFCYVMLYCVMLCYVMLCYDFNGRFMEDVYESSVMLRYTLCVVIFCSAHAQYPNPTPSSYYFHLAWPSYRLSVIK
jgi:hypothetical protein